MKESKYFWFMIQQTGKRKDNPTVISKDQSLGFDKYDLWLYNYLCSLKNEDKSILISKEAWFSYCVMEAAQKRIGRVLGAYCN